jgi:hypothetical protein
MSQAKENAVRKYDQFIEMIEARIAKTNAEGKNLPATTLAKEIGPTFGWEWPQAYQFIKAYIDERDDLEIKHGPRGGISPCKDSGIKKIDSEQ